jgi:hypothetical protein
MAGTAVVITQPTYLPWLGYFEQMASGHLRLSRQRAVHPRSWQCRNRLAGPDGSPYWLTVPVAKHSRQAPIREVRISPDQPRWRAKHLTGIRHELGAAPFFRSLIGDIENWLLGPWEYMADLNIAGIRMIARWLGLEPKFLLASVLDVSGRNVDLLIAICHATGADHYYTALGSKTYIENDPEAFSRAGVLLEYQQWPHPEYDQGRPFVSHLAAIDAILRIGPEKTRELILAK